MLLPFNAHAGHRGADRLDVVLIILGLIGSAANGGRLEQMQTPYRFCSMCLHAPRCVWLHGIESVVLCRRCTAGICRCLRQPGKQVRDVRGVTCFCSLPHDSDGTQCSVKPWGVSTTTMDTCSR